MTADWEEDVQERISGLGEPTAEFAIGRRRLIRNLLVASLMIVVGLALALLLVFSLKHFHFHVVKIAALGAFMCVGGVVFLVRACRNLGMRVLVYPEGVVQLRKDQMRAAFWDEIDTISFKSSSRGLHSMWTGESITLHCSNGQEITFDDSLPRMQELVEMVQRETLPSLLARAVEGYQSGRTLDFGKLCVNQGGVSQEKQSLAWADIQEIKFHKSGVAIYKKGKWTGWGEATVSETANFHVLRPFLTSVSSVKITVS
jgi:hypothetical protein